MNVASSGRRCVLFLIDLEPDLRKIRGGQGGWEGSRKALPYLETLRRRLEDRTETPVEFNWFLRADPQIRKRWGKAHWVVEACPDLIETIGDRGDYCGIHPHLWRWNQRLREWFNELADPAWTAECLQTSIEAFQQIFHRLPEACRFGDRWLNQNAVELMRASGIRYDLTVEPGLPDVPVFDDPHATGRLPDYRRAPRVPYRPSSENFLTPTSDEAKDNSLWIVPLSTTAPVWQFRRRRPYLLKVSRSPNLSYPSSEVWPHLRTELDLATSVPLVMVVRTGDCERAELLENFLETTGQLAQHPALARCRFTNPAAAVARWQAPR
jgi:hypothetical protein